MAEKMLITPEGYRKLLEEMEDLQKNQRPAIIKEIEEARAKGDLSENAEYHAAKEKHALIENRISELSKKINNAQVVDPETVPKDRVNFGCKVILYDIEKEEEIEYMIVGEDESDPENGKISINSPIARSLLGKQEGDEVEVKVPAGVRRFEIEEIK
ncbi:transcription elongation factor GreA [Hippea maritima]|uniref:Transcription elongation factor GreA n=1 Tax=Hippea maritima (strain ATCC 700847 / DSM 10411 / MH2) TaxID=760142 RepID=F2LWW0_HIPMA|nr:transcription elongation factor GreA [Hippea maritima]AEA34144.1 transcription elongation factor GreA [Hippea maritima DSM 10411]